MKELSSVIQVDQEKCKNCHACITACPVKYCNLASDDHVTVNQNLCIGCGECIKACTHNARTIVDDIDAFKTDLLREKIIAIAAPAVAPNYPDKHLHLNGWLGSLGVAAFFDVSFGAELTVKSYLEHIRTHHPKAVIAQPCPAIVNYIEIYQPELLPYLAPADSPMMHTIKMVREFYPQYRKHKILIISPCVAKKREFKACGLGDYNVTMASLDKWIEKERINLSSFAPVDYENPPAERAVLFSTPGGLMRTVEREFPGVYSIARKIEGPGLIYEYLKQLPAMIKKERNPLLVDCLNCEAGCNGGTGTNSSHKSMDELEYWVEKRNREMQEKYRQTGWLKKGRVKSKLKKTIEKFWRPGLYDRRYIDRSENDNIKIPNATELKEVYHTISKYSDDDIYNCGACGYGSCKDMATALFNGLNKPENCLHHQFHLHNVLHKELLESSNRLDDMAISVNQKSSAIKERTRNVSSHITELSEFIERLSHSSEENRKVMTNISVSTDQMSSTINMIAKNSTSTRDFTLNAVENMQHIRERTAELEQASGDIKSVIKLIFDIADQTKLLAINATIEAARAGEAGKGFGVVANEVKNLAEQTNEATRAIREKIERIAKSTGETIGEVNTITKLMDQINEMITMIATGVDQQSQTTKDMNLNVMNFTASMEEINTHLLMSAEKARYVNQDVNGMHDDIRDVDESVILLKEKSDQLAEICAGLGEKQNGNGTY